MNKMKDEHSRLVKSKDQEISQLRKEIDTTKDSVKKAQQSEGKRNSEEVAQLQERCNNAEQKISEYLKEKVSLEEAKLKAE